jgi:hypothetical protein
MARQPTGNPVGRPPKPINWEEFEKLCEMQCTQSEIASFFKIHPETLSTRVGQEYGEDYSIVYKKNSESGKCSLRRAQFKLAMKNSSMAIWLGKQWLGQKDVSKEEMQDIAKELINAVRECEGVSGADETKRSSLEAQQSVLDKGCSGEANQVSNELGAAGVT